MLLEPHHTPFSVLKLMNLHSTSDDRAESAICFKTKLQLPEPCIQRRLLRKIRQVFQNKPNQIPPLGIRVSSDLHAVAFRKKSIAQSTTIATPWLLSRPVVDLRLHCSDKDITPPDIFKNCFYELYHSYINYYRIYTDGSKSGDRIGVAVVYRSKTKRFDFQTLQASSGLSCTLFCSP